MAQMVLKSCIHLIGVINVVETRWLLVPFCDQKFFFTGELFEISSGWASINSR